MVDQILQRNIKMAFSHQLAPKEIHKPILRNKKRIPLMMGGQIHQSYTSLTIEKK